MILQRYILKDLIVTFALAFTAIASVCALGVIFQTFRAYEGMTFDYLLRLAPAALAQMAPWAMIVSSCLTTTLVYGRLAADNELDAVRTSGIHVGRMLMPALLLGVLLSGAAYFLHGEAAPRARYARRTLIRETLLMVLRNPPSGRQNDLKIGSRNRLSYEDTGERRLVNPSLLILDGNRPEFLWKAREGLIRAPDGEDPSITLIDAAFIKFNPRGRPDEPINQAEGTLHDRQLVKFELDDIYRVDKTIGDMPTHELGQYCAVVDDGHRSQALTEYHARFARSIAPFVLVLLCLPIGVFVKKGSRLAGMGAALPPLLIYLMLMIAGEGMGGKGRISPVLATYGSVGVLTILAGALLTRVWRR